MKRLTTLLVLAVCVAVAGCSSDDGGTDVTTVPDLADLATGDAPVESDVPTGDVPAGDVPAGDVPAGDTDMEGWPKKLTILHTNDLHSHLMGFGPEADYSPATTGDDDTVGGFARVAAIIKAEKAAAEGDVLVLDVGDFTMGSMFALLSATAGVELKLMDAMGIQATCVGNHELDWGPNGLAAIVAKGKEDTSISVLASNLVTDPDDAGDDAVEQLFAGGLIQTEMTIVTEGGLTVGLFGLMGNGAADDAPFMPPLTTNEDLAAVAGERVESLRGQGADLVLALSHAGVVSGAIKYEDEKLAADVDGLDIIVSGHTHSALTEEYEEGDDDTIIVQAGNYGMFVGKLVVNVYADHTELVSYELLTVDDSVQGDPEIQAMVDGYIAALDTQLAAFGLAYGATLAETSSDIVTLEMAESGAGNLVTDAHVWAVNQIPGTEAPVTLAFEANGVIRDSILKGTTGAIWAADAFRVLPLGIGPDQIPGYSMATFYITAQDLKSAAEAVVAIPKLKGNSYFLQFSGFKFTYSETGDLFNMVQGIWLKDGDGYSDTPLDFSEANTELYRVSVNAYVAAMMYVLADATGGLLSVTPRDADGNPIADLSTTTLDVDPTTDGIQELKLWQTLFNYLAHFEDTNGNDIPDVPASYGAPEGRMQVVD